MEFQIQAREPLINYRLLSAPYELFGKAHFAGNIEREALEQVHTQLA
ncbi:MAG: hypothetical protein IH908_12420 [Proteobacteria bacterium]|nr:hypothetical protein [Pseudomonadota bacterium]